MTYDPDVAVAHLRASDPTMSRIIDRVGPFAMRRDSSDPFRALARAIIFQQLSGAAAGTIYGRLLALFDGQPRDRGTVARRSSPSWDPATEPFPPPAVLRSRSPEELRAVGLSRQKAAFLHALADHFIGCESCPEGRFGPGDDEVLSHLIAIPGIGTWSAQMFLIFHLLRPDVLPFNDVGINRAIARSYGLAAPPSPAEITVIAAPWRPYASVACWYLWRSEDVTAPG